MAGGEQAAAGASRHGAARPGTVLSAAESEAMAALRSCLAASPYPVLHSLAAGGQQLVADVAAALARADGGPDWALYRLLGLGRRVAAAELDHAGRAAAEQLTAAGLVDSEDGLCVTTGWIVVPALRGFLVTGLPPTHGGASGASAYLGNDSFKLAGLLPDAAGRRVLDVGSGCGIQGLLACRGAAARTLTDIDAFAVRVGGLNAALNGVAHPVRVLRGSLYEPVAGERFDLVVSLPPYMPVVHGSGVTTSAGGGPDGLDVVQPLIVGAPEVLSDGGELYALAQLLCDDDGPLVRDSLGAVASLLDLELYCWDRHPLRPWIAEIAGVLAKQRHSADVLAGVPAGVSTVVPADAGELIAAYSESLRALGASGICTVLVRARAGRPPGLRISGPAGALVPSSVLRHAGRIVAGAANLEAVALEGGTVQHLDPLGMALLRGIDGARDLAEAAAAAWGEPQDADWREIEEMAVWRGGELVRAGLVVGETGPDALV
ncbi:MAG TPA: methyltransferase, partial [Acidimicrobiales bacterium]|nr:methyltransferase [Acidimicrobiales bacterium]